MTTEEQLKKLLLAAKVSSGYTDPKTEDDAILIQTVMEIQNQIIQ